MRSLKVTFLLALGLLVVGSANLLFVSAASARPAVAVRCERVGTAIDNLIAHYKANHTRHVERYQQVHDNITAKLADLEAAGLDVAELTTDLGTLNAYILSFNQSHTTFQAQLRESKELVCGGSEGAYRAKVQEARDQLKAMRETARDAIALIRTEIRADLQELRTQANGSDER